MKSRIGFLAALVFACPYAHSQENKGTTEVVPDAEYETAKQLGLEGPAKTKGISSVDQLGLVELAEEFPEMEGRQFRAREITIEPGGVVAVHRHQARPGFAYILEGEIIEHRNDHPEPLLRKKGDIAVEKTGVAHWWENKSERPVRALIVDIIKPGSE